MNTSTLNRFFELVAENELDTAFEELELLIQKEAPLLMVDFITLCQRRQAIEDDYHANTITQEDKRVEESKLVRDFLYLVQQLPTDEEQQTSSATSAAIISGKLLHDIPARFPLERLTKCVIRIADTEKALLKNFKPSPDTVIEDDIAIEKVMAVELLDIEAGENFEIKALNSAIQQLLSAQPTQWVYYVKALNVGVHLLVLRVSTVEVIDGVERAKEVLFERTVSVEAEVKEQTVNDARNWQATNLTIDVRPVYEPNIVGGLGGGLSRQDIIEAAQSAPPSSSPIPMPAPKPKPRMTPAPVARNSSRGLPWSKMAASLLVLLLAGWWIVNTGIDDPDSGGATPSQTEEPNRPNETNNNKSIEELLAPSTIVGVYRKGEEEITISYEAGGQFYVSGPVGAPVFSYPIESSGLSFVLVGTNLKYRFVLDQSQKEILGFETTDNPKEIWLKQ